MSQALGSVQTPDLTLTKIETYGQKSCDHVCNLNLFIAHLTLSVYPLNDLLCQLQLL